MKKYFVLLVFLCLFGCLYGEPTYKKLTVLSTTAMIDDLVGKVGGEKIVHMSLIQGEMDPHSYELVKGDDEKIGSADIVFSNGLSLEHGASLCYQLKKHPNSVYLGDLIEKKYPEKILKTGGQKDPHIWMDVSLWAEGVDAIVDALSQKDPKSAEYFVNNGKALKDKMKIAHEGIYQLMQGLPDGKRFLVTSHDAFHYFARAYLGSGTDRCVAPEGLAPEGQLCFTDIRRVTEHLCLQKISVVFPESNVSQAALQKIVACCKAKGHTVRISTAHLYSDAMGKASSYIEMIEHNAKTLKQEWEK